MTHEIDLATGQPSTGPVLILGDTRLQCRPMIGVSTLARATSAYAGVANDAEWYTRLAEFIEDCIEDPDGKAEFRRLYNDPRDTPPGVATVTQPGLIAAYTSLVEAYSGRPTDEPSGSSPSSATPTTDSGVSSTPASSSPVAPDSTPSMATPAVS